MVAAAATPFALVAYLADAVGWESWGGLMLNVCLAIASMILCFPPGSSPRWAAARPCRRSAGTSTGYIELFRGAPRFVRLLMANVALGRPSGAPLHRRQEERTKEFLAQIL